MTRLIEARQRFAADWQDLRSSLSRETGREPRWSRSLIGPALALALGVAFGAGVWRRRSRNR